MILQRLGFDREREAPAGPLILDEATRGNLLHERLLAELGKVDAPGHIGVCACHAGAGASTVAVALAQLLSIRVGRPVGLVEANLRTPSLERIPGLVNAEPWNARHNFESGWGRTFSPLTGSDVHVSVARRSGKPLSRLRRLLEAWVPDELRFERIVVDLPPVLSFPDAGIMGGRLDGVLLVLEADRSRWQVAKEAKLRLESAGCRVIGAVLNKKARHVPNWIYRLL